MRIAIQDFVRDDVEEIHSILANPDAPLEDQEQLKALVAEEVLYKDVWGLSSSLETPEKLEHALEQVSRTAQYLFGYSRPVAANPDAAIRLFLENPEGVRSMTVAQAKSVFERPFNLFAWQRLPLDLHDVRLNLAIDKKIAKVEKRLTKRYKAVAKKRAEEDWLKFWLHLTEGTKTVEELLRCEDERPRRVSLLLGSPQHSDYPDTPVQEEVSQDKVDEENVITVLTSSRRSCWQRKGQVDLWVLSTCRRMARRVAMRSFCPSLSFFFWVITGPSEGRGAGFTGRCCSGRLAPIHFLSFFT